MPLTEVQQVNNTWDQGDTKTITFTEPTQNNLLVIRFVSDVVPTTPTNWLRVDPYPGGSADVGIFCRLAPAGMGTTLTLTAAGDTVAVFQEFSGNITSSIANCLDQHTTADDVKSTGTTGTTTQADELALAVIGAGANESGLWSAYTNSFVEDADLQSPGGAGTEVTGGFASRALSATGTFSTSATNGAPAGSCSGAIATFKAAAAGTDLVIANATHAQTADNLTLTQVHQLAVNNAAHAQTANNLALTQAHELAVANAVHGQTADNVALTQAHNLTVANATHSQTADNVVLNTANQLVIADAVHAQTAGQVTLTQVHELSVASAAHAQSAQALTLTQIHQLAVANATHAQLVDQLILAIFNAQSTPTVTAGRTSTPTIEAGRTSTASVLAGATSTPSVSD